MESIFSQENWEETKPLFVFLKKKRKIEFKHLLVTLLDSELNVL